MQIRFDEKNLRAEMVGEAHGVTAHEVELAFPEAHRAFEAFHASKVGRRGFPTLVDQAAVLDEIEAYAASQKGGYDTVCVVGIGGSALGAWALDCGMRGPHPVQGTFSPERPRLVVLDNIDPDFIALARHSIVPERTLLVVIGKAGDTAETVSAFLVMRQWMGAAAAGRIVVVTTKGVSELWKLAEANGYPSFHIPPHVGGRFSVFSPVGLVPAALLGIDIRRLMAGVSAMTEICWNPDIRENIALRSALYHYLILEGRHKTIQVAFPYSYRLWGTAFWFRQLWAESLGKVRTEVGQARNIGQTPVAALGPTDQHSQVQLYVEGPNDKVFTFWTIANFADDGAIPAEPAGQPSFDALAGKSLKQLIQAEQFGTAAALVKYHRPNCCFELERLDEEHLGAFLQMLEFQTAFLGALLRINAFNQPGVQLGKKYTNAEMKIAGHEAEQAELAAYRARRDALK
jgi:glucose-6-phosphate isomerase